MSGATVASPGVVRMLLAASSPGTAAWERNRLDALDALEEACRAALELAPWAEAVGCAAAENRSAKKAELEVERIENLLRSALRLVEGRE